MYFASVAGAPFLRVFAALFPWPSARSSIRPTRWSVRPLSSSDGPALEAMLAGLTPRSCRLRYGRSALDCVAIACEVRRLLMSAAVLVALADEHGDQRVVGVAELALHGDDAEAAVVVADDHQGRGLGRELVQALVGLAEQRGVAALCFDTLVENTGMCRLVQGLGLLYQERRGNGEVSFRVAIGS